MNSKQKTENSGNYASDVERVVGLWVDWCADKGATELDDVDARLLRHWTSGG